MLFFWAVAVFLFARVEGEYGESSNSIIRLNKESENRGQLVLSAEPTLVEGGSADPLLVTCNFTGQRDDQIIAMTISKEKGPDNLIDGGDLAGISAFKNQVSKVDDTLGAEISGDLSQRNSGFLRLSWKNPPASVQGAYVCSASLLKKSFGTSALTSKVRVMYKPPRMSDLLNRLSRLQDENERLKSSQDARQMRLRFLENLVFWVSEPWNGRRYFLSHHRARTIEKSESICEGVGGYLVESDTKEEYDFITKFIHTYPDQTFKRRMHVIFGATDRAREGHWVNVHSGKPLGYYNWRNGQPDNGGGIEDCSEYIVSWSAMNDCDCIEGSDIDYNSRFLCEVPL